MTSHSEAVTRLGLRFELDLRDNLQRVLFFTGTYEPEVLHHIDAELRKGDIVTDCGAHIGVHALPLARKLQKLGGGKVYAFEPAPDTAAKLIAGATANQLDVEVIPLALSDRRGTLTLRYDARYDEADLGIRSEYSSGEAAATSETTTFDDWASSAGLQRLDIVKIDVEGGELAVLQGMETSLRRFLPRVVIVETKTGSLERAGVTASDIHDLLNDVGYRFSETVPFGNDIFVPV